MRMRVEGLSESPQYNCQLSTIEREAEGGRLRVVLDQDGKVLSLKRENFVLLPCRRSDAPPFFSPGRSDDGILLTPPSSTSPRSDDGILPTPPFYTRLPSTYSLRSSGSSPTRSGLPQKASSIDVIDVY